MEAYRKSFFLLFKAICQTLDTEIKDENKRRVIFDKILDNFIVEMKLQLSSLK